MSGFSWCWSIPTDRTVQIRQLFSQIIEYDRALFTLISSSYSPTFFAISADKSISKKQITMLTMKLSRSLLNHTIILEQMHKNILRNFGMGLATRSAEMIKRNTEPLVNAFMKSMISIAYLSRRNTFFQCFYFCCCPVFISPTDKLNIISHQSAESCIDIS